MILIVFAHKNEALSFIDQLYAEKLKGDIFHAYKFSQGYILITGEGMTDTLQATAGFLGTHADEIEKVINVGVCGSLPFSKQIEKNDVISIRTVYAEKSSSEPHFKSFTTNDTSATVDCITSIDRVTTDNYAHRLGPFADLVDREAWCVASAAQQFKKSFYSYKLISDVAGEQTQCFEVRQVSALYSQKLFDFFTKQLQLNDQQQHLPQTPTNINFSIIKKDFYVTTSQKQKLSKLIISLEQRQNQSSKEIFEWPAVRTIAEENIHPKLRTQKLIQYLSDELTPFQKQLKSQLINFLSDYESDNFKISVDDTFEKEEVSIQLTANNQESLSELSDSVKSFPIDDLTSILRGKFTGE